MAVRPESLVLGGPRSSYKVVEHLCQLTRGRSSSFLLAMQAGLEPRSGNGSELSGLMSVMPNYTCIV